MELASSGSGNQLIEAGGAQILSLPELPRERIAELVADMNTKGYGVLPGYLQPEDLARLRGFVEGAVSAAGEQYVSFTGAEPVKGTLLQVLSNSPAFADLLHQLYELGAGVPAPKHHLPRLHRHKRL